MAAPTLILTDHLNATSGDLVIEVGHAAHFECVSASAIGAGDWTQAKIEWSVNDAGSDYSSSMRGFNFSHYFAGTGMFVVTCTVTNMDGEYAVQTRTVAVAASTRATVNVTNGQDLKTVHDVNAGDNKEFVISGTVTCSAAIAPGSNNVFRSDAPDTQVNVDWSGGAALCFDLGNVNAVTWKDIHFRIGGASRCISVIRFGGMNNNVLNCTVDSGVCSGQMLNCAPDPRGVLIQDCITTHDSAGQNIWFGNGVNSRMLSVYGGSHIASADNSERALRGAALYVSLCDSYFELANVGNGKDVLSVSDGGFRYAYRSQFVNSTASGTGTLLFTGHSSGSAEVTDIVFDRCYMGFPYRLGQWRIGIAAFGSCARLMVRNCVILNTQLTFEHASIARFHHNTNYNPVSGTRWLSINPTAFNVDGLTLTGNLSVNAVTLTESILINSQTDTGSEFTAVENNVTGAVSQEDVEINDSVNGDKDEQYSTFNARANASGNLRKAVSIHGSTFRPVDLDDTDILVVPFSETAIFNEDYYGRLRGASWAVGAVDRATEFLVIQAGGGLFAIQS